MQMYLVDIEVENLYNEIVGNLGRGDTRELADIAEFTGDVGLADFIARRGFEEIASEDRREHMVEMIRYVRGK
jgi:hypothetical protein